MSKPRHAQRNKTRPASKLNTAEKIRSPGEINPKPKAHRKTSQVVIRTSVGSSLKVRPCSPPCSTKPRRQKVKKRFTLYNQARDSLLTSFERQMITEYQHLTPFKPNRQTIARKMMLNNHIFGQHEDR